MAPKPKFQEGEKVLCYHGPLLYEAKCTKFEVKDGKVQYLIHYNGWNKNWDESVQESRVVKHNEAGLQKQRELLKNHGAMTKKKKAAKKLEKEALKQQKSEKSKKEKEKPNTKEKEPLQSSKDKASTKEKQSVREEKKKEKEKETKEKEKEKESTPSQTTAGEKRKEREKEKEKEKEKKEQEKEKEKITTVLATQPSVIPAVDNLSNSLNNSQSGEPKRKRARLDNATVEIEDAYLCKIEVKIKIPEDLKPVLVDDWDLITRQKMLVTLPCKHTVDDIIEEYIKTKSAKNSNVNKDAILETMLGCKDYFNVMLGSQLLYKFERPQYGEILAENSDKPMSSLYGPIHFLRLFVRLGAMLAFTSIDERTVHILLNHIHDFLKYMSKNGPTLFKTSLYEIAPPDYHRKAI